MKPKVELKRTLRKLHGDVQQQFFTGSHVPESLVGMVRNFQEACIAQGVEDKLYFKESVVKCCEIQIGALHLDLTTLDEEKVKKCLEASEQIEKAVDKENEQTSGRIDWQFTGVNQFGAVTIRVKKKSWQVEFSRLQRRISALITSEISLKPKAHQALYEKMKKSLQPIAPSAPSEMLILQGTPGLGKSHCTEHYFYHEANKRHQMVAWLSGESEDAFLRDWEALANQLRVIDAQRSTDSDTLLIRHWCEKQLSQWLFIIDDLQIEIDWLKAYLPQKGGHVLITTTQPCYGLSQEAKVLCFSPLSSEDSVLLLKAWLGKYWEALGHTKEVQALSYFSEALGGSPALLTQIALLIRKKGLSFERVMTQFQDVETRSLLLADAVFDQLRGQTFLECVKKSWRQWMVALRKHYPQLTYEEHEAHFKQFIGFLKQQVEQVGEEFLQGYVDEKLIIEYWQGVWASLSCVPLTAEQITACLNVFPFSYDKTHQRWVVSLATLHALECQGSAKDLFPPLPEIKAMSAVQKEKLDLYQLPLSVNLTIDLENSSLSSVDIALLTTSNAPEFTTWRLPTTNPYFIPRPKLTKEIAEKLPSKTTREQSAELVLAAASGMGGIGKTELARHFITTPELSSHYKKRFWFNAVSTSTLRNEFHNFASFLGLIEPKVYLEDNVLIHRLHGWFNLNPGWLIVLDNADDYSSIAQWIPKEGGSVLITTREPKPGTLMDEQIVKIPLLTGEEAIIWLYRLAQRDPNTATEAERHAARSLVENLGYLPLAIAQSAAYLREQETVSIEAYQQNFLELLLKDESLIERDKPIDKQSDAYSRRVIASTWNLSLERIEAHAKKKGIPNISSWLLVACSYLASKDIPMALLEYWFKTSLNLETISPQLLSYLLDEYTAQLVRYSLCERAGLTAMISMHRLVQEVLRSELIEAPSLQTEQGALPAEIGDLAEQIMQKDWIKKVVFPRVFPSLSVALIRYSAEFDLSIADIKRRIELISHLQTIIATWEVLNYQDEIDLNTTILLYQRLVAIQLYLRLDAKESLIVCQRQLDLVQKHYGPEHFKVAGALTTLGLAYGLLGNAQQQKSLLERALPILEQHYGPEHLVVTSTLMDLGGAYGALGDARHEKSLLEGVLPILEKHYGLEHLHVATILMNLGNAYGALGDAQQQKSLLERVLRIKEHCYGSEHPEMATVLMNLGNAYGALGDAKQAKIFLERALSIFERHYGSEHPEVAKTLANLGVAYGALGDAEQQKRLLERTLRFDECYYGPEHPHVATTLVNLGSAYGNLGDAQQEKMLLERALAIFERYYGPEHSQVAKALTNLSIVHGALGDAQQKKTLLERVLCIYEHYYGSNHPEVARTLVGLGNAYGALGDAQQKKMLLERALPIFEHYYGSEHLKVAVILFELGYAYDALGDIQQQKDVLERVLPIFEQSYGPEHSYMLVILTYLSKAYDALGDAKQRDILFARAAFIEICNNGLCTPALSKKMGDLLLFGEQPLKAISYYEKALEIDPQFPEIHHNLACCYHLRGDIEKADACFQQGIALFPTPSILAEYVHFLIKQKRFQESLPFIEQCLQAVTDGGVVYDIAVYATVLPAIQSLIDRHPSHVIGLSAQGLAHYLRIFCYQICQKEEQAQQAIKHFELWIAQQPDPRQQEIFQFLKSSLNLQVERNSLKLLSLEQQFFPAVIVGDLNIVQSIIEKQDFSIDWQENDSQRTALHLACISQQRDIIVYLLSKLACFDIKDKEGKLAWEYVINTPFLELFKTTSVLFAQKYSAAVNAGIFLDWGKVLRMAVVNNYLADVRFLIEVKGIDVNSVDANPKTQYTALHLAVIRNKPEVAKYLISQGADVNVLDASQKASGDYITPEQKELLSLFPITAKSVSAEEDELDLEKLRL